MSDGVAIAAPGPSLRPTAGSRPWGVLALGGTLAAATVGLAFLTMGHPLLTLLPILLAVLAWWFWRAPMRQIAILTLFIALVLDADMRPTKPFWDYPLEPLRVLFFENLHKVIPIAALKMSTVDLLVVLLGALIVYRRAVRDPEDGRGVASPSWLRALLVLSLGGMLFMAAWGFLRGGSFQKTYWQMRQPLFVPLLAFLFLASFRGTRDHLRVAGAVVAAAVAKALISLYFYEFIARPMNFRPSYVTNHADSVLYVSALVIAILGLVEKVSFKARLYLGLSIPFVLSGLYVNDRRLAWVEIAFALLTIYALTPRTALKRWLARTAVTASPVLLLYVAVGWSSGSPIFRPVQTIRSVVDSNVDRSSLDRDVENFNLALTLRGNPIVGTGFGHEYDEVYKADDISGIFPEYRFIPHNAVLGLLAFGGMVGFTLIWLPIVAGLFLAMRSYPRARTPEGKASALAVVAVLVAYMLQGWGDMGIQSWLDSFLAAAALAVAGQLAVAVGAWPSRAHPAPLEVRP